VSDGIRDRFWDRALELLERDAPGSERFKSLQELVAEYAHGHDLLTSEPLEGIDSPNAICVPLPLAEKGYRAFLKVWTQGERTLIHGHPSTMFVYPITAHLENTEYGLVDGRPEPVSVRIHGPGQTMVGAADNERHDNFIHSLRCVQPGWSLHIYSDSGARGPRFDYSGELILGARS